MILFKFIQRGELREINGCISTGKEANVYYATRDGKNDCAIKIYKTSILVFKDRDKYVTGEYRFRHGYSRHNPRKMVRLWAEKEYRNLIRLHQNGIPCPKAIDLKEHVLLMEFIGENGWPAPLLKEITNLEETQAYKLYIDLIGYMRIMYDKCKLVHADLSEFNILYHLQKLFIIDVSQSVEQSHPNALEFLRKDCHNVNDYFQKKLAIKTLTTKELFDYITDPTIDDNNEQQYLDKILSIAQERQYPLPEEQIVSDQVFKSIYIPQTLIEVVDYEKDFRQCKTNGDQNLSYATLHAMKDDLSGARLKPKLLEEEEEEDDDNTNDDTTSSCSTTSDDSFQSANEELTKNNVSGIIRPRNESPASKKLRKQAVKEENREKRKTKIKKHIKKRAEKLGGDSRKRRK
ncbi:unnamed protein product [Didymodactylos carnosus]|nr:unnamed protein product [Didymodactylos carnosus]CAF3759998.1 unnamed protein product [Didymodactylos carnosus]